MNPMLHCFGDSWAAGAELTPSQQPFVYWLSQKLACEYVNHGKQGSSLGLILHTVVANLKTINHGDFVVVIIPPDVRWYEENEQQGFYSLANHQQEEYFRFLHRKSLEWFRYHHAIFIYTIQNILQDRGAHFVMTHNYGQINEVQKYGLDIDLNKFLSQSSLTELLQEKMSQWHSYPKEHHYEQDGPGQEHFHGIYFQGCQTHPNELGHQRIAELLHDKFRKTYQI